MFLPLRAPLFARGGTCRLLREASSIPVRIGLVIRVELLRPLLVGHRRPVVLVEPRRVLQSFLVDIEDEAMVGRIDLQRKPWDGEQLVSQAEKSAERQNGIRHFAGW